MAVYSSPTELPLRRKAPPAAFTPSSNINITTKNTTPPTTDRVDRTSFSSIKESHGGIAQTFTDSKTSSYLHNQVYNEDAIIDDSSSGNRTPEVERREFGGMITNPHSNLFAFTPCDGFKGWKDIPLMAQTIKNIKSKSYSDLARLHRGFQWEVGHGDRMDLDEKEEDTILPPGKSRLESLPTELLGAIIDQLAIDIPPNGCAARNIDLMSLLLTSHTIYSATLATLYNQITIPHSRIFAKFLAHIANHPALGTIVRRLDFSHFNPTGAGMTARERAQTQNLIPKTLLRCLELTPNLREFLAQEHIDDDLSSDVLSKLFTDMPRLKAVDFCACSSASFRNAFTTIVSNPSSLPERMSITRLSLHECTILPSSIFFTLLPRLPHLTHLDVAHTRIASSALQSIPKTAKLTHLNLSKCSFLSGESVAEFLASHPAARGLVYLNLAMDPKSHEMLPANLLAGLLPTLPSTLRSLNLKGSKMDGSHIPLLLPLSKHVEELGLGRHLTLPDIEKLFVPDCTLPLEQQLSWIPHSLRYIDISDLSSSDLDLSSLFGSSCPILKSIAEPLEVIEVGADVLKRLQRSDAVLKRVGWCVKEAGRRAWLVRKRNVGVDEEVDDGSRGWKWGACYWGMRKVPVARAEVGGMYGHYMFKR
ncbi:related to Leucine Rich Repeat domain protein [Phialocephala subalpina]|uniref:Related to Leucine Rich Repeat domain protein n=1 Tax=Phialocephala subalpina TaxID=576137 RepID=A0A1L7WZ30_9HELO|nr:related to Leucine Rich Repeat domain protein [Phialocephala subalpina]